MEILEERNDALILLAEEKSVQVLEKSPYNLLKYKCYHGRKIRFIVTDAEEKITLEETDQDGTFLCTFLGIAVTMADSREKIASAIFEAQSTGNTDTIRYLWKLKHVEEFLSISVVLEANAQLELTREGKLLIPKFASLEILEWMERPDGGRVAKVELSRGSKAPVDRIFTHEIKDKKGQTRNVINDTAVLLIGRDETEQCWMHVVPPEYRSRSIGSCEMWLAGGVDGEDELIDVPRQDD